MSIMDQDQPGHAPNKPSSRLPVRTALAAVLLAGTALGGFAIGHSSPAAEPATQDHVIRPTPPQATLPDFSHLVKQVEPAVVSITTKLRTSQVAEEVPQVPFPLPFNFGQGQGHHNRRAIIEARGSGFVIDAKGYIVTNNHVVHGAKSVSVTFADGTELPAKIVGRDVRTDLALLKVDAGHHLPYVELGNSSSVEPGQWVIAIGNPYGLGDTVTAGIVSARGRDIGAGPYDNFIQVDAPINKGNSGGPLFTQNGEVIGVTTAILSPTGGSIGIGFAIPSNTVKQVISQLESSGHVVRGYLGVEAQPVAKSIATALNLPEQKIENGEAKGALIASVQPNSPASKAGLQPGDVIELVNGKPIASPHALAMNIAGIKPGAQAKVTVFRNGKTESFDVNIGTLPGEQVASAAQHQGQDEQGSQAKVGLALQPLTPDLRKQLDLPDHTRGAVVAQVVPGSPADKAGIQAGDVVVGVGTNSVSNPNQAVDAIRKAVKEHHAVALRVMRNGQAVYVALDMSKSSENNAENSQG